MVGNDAPAHLSSLPGHPVSGHNSGELHILSSGTIGKPSPGTLVTLLSLALGTTIGVTTRHSTGTEDRGTPRMTPWMSLEIIDYRYLEQRTIWRRGYFSKIVLKSTNVHVIECSHVVRQSWFSCRIHEQ